MELAKNISIYKHIFLIITLLNFDEMQIGQKLAMPTFGEDPKTRPLFDA